MLNGDWTLFHPNFDILVIRSIKVDTLHAYTLLPGHKKITYVNLIWCGNQNVQYSLIVSRFWNWHEESWALLLISQMSTISGTKQALETRLRRCCVLLPCFWLVGSYKLNVQFSAQVHNECTKEHKNKCLLMKNNLKTQDSDWRNTSLKLLNGNIRSAQFGLTARALMVLVIWKSKAKNPNHDLTTSCSDVLKASQQEVKLCATLISFPKTHYNKREDSKQRRLTS